MTFYYNHTVAEAYTSVQYLITDVQFRWLIPSFHHVGAQHIVLDCCAIARGFRSVSSISRGLDFCAASSVPV